MSATVDPSLKHKLNAVEAELRELRDQRADAVRQRDIARDKFAAVDGYDTASPEFKAASAAVKALAEIDGEIERKHAAQVGILTMISGANAGTRAADLTPEDRDIVKGLTREPGRLLSTILSRRASEIPRFRDDERMKAAPTQLGTADVTVFHETDAIIDLLTPLAVATRSGIPILSIDGTKTEIPRFVEAPVAGWKAEFGPFVKNTPGIEMVEVIPPLVGLVSPLSLEVYDDLTPVTMAMLQVQLMRAVALAYDRGILFGSGTAPEPRGVANTTGVLAASAPLTNLAAFADALAGLLATNATPGALVMSPLDIGTLLKLTESDSGPGSNVPLWKASIGSPSGLRLPYFDVPIWPTPACPQGTALLYDPSTVIAVIRRPADLAVDPFYDVDHGVVGLRVYMRADVVVGQAKGTVKITFTP